LRQIRLDTIAVPDFGQPTNEPTVPPEEYVRRISLVRQVMKKRKLDALVVYGDREHSANISFLCGYDPRFEESLLLLHRESHPVLMVGNEGWAYADEVLQVEVEKRLVQSFSLIGQPRDSMKEPVYFLKEAGIRPRMKVGVAGWKYFTREDFRNAKYAVEIPSYLVDSLREIVGPRGLVLNANDIFMDPDQGLRTVNDVDQIAQFEFAAVVASQGVRKMLEEFTVGMTEYEAVQLMKLNGMPLSCHVNLCTGTRVRSGMASPSMKIIEKGDPLTAAVGLRGGLICRQGYVVEGQGELSVTQPKYLEDVCIPYFSLVADWYEAIGIGVAGGEIQSKINATNFPLTLNPGHYVHLEEWVSSPFYNGSKVTLKSGMAINVDMIPKMTPGKSGNNLEDTIVIADKDLRHELQAKYPDVFERIERRRNFITGVLNIKIKPEVLPLSNYPAVLRPFLLDRSRILRLVR